MSVRYKFPSLDKLADYLAEQARQMRISIETTNPKNQKNLGRRGEAFAHEMIADMLRSTDIEAAGDAPKVARTLVLPADLSDADLEEIRTVVDAMLRMAAREAAV